MGRYFEDWGGGGVEEEYLIILIIYSGGIFLREIKRDVYIAVALTGRSTTRVVSHLNAKEQKAWLCAN